MVHEKKAKERHYTALFKGYALQLVFRFVLFGAAIWSFICAPLQLSMSEGFGFAHGFTLIDFIFIVLVADMVTKFIPNAKLSVGSLKQYRRFHVPTAALFKNGREGLVAYGREMIDQGKLAVEGIPEKLRAATEETLQGLSDTKDSITKILGNFAIFRLLPFKDSQLEAPLPLRDQIRHDRYREIIPVLIFWIVFNAALFILFSVLGIFTQQLALVWVLFYFLFDMICVVLWCPLQVVFMKNRCCTTCQIFNWDALMTVTPLLFFVFDLSTAWFAWPLLVMAIVIVVHWELAFIRHPERFDERTNASLQCANCNDKLCVIRDPLLTKLKNLPEPIGSIVANVPTSEPETHQEASSSANAEN